MSELEISHWELNHLVVGVDEVGRGALAGPVVAAAVVFNPDDIPPGIADSKTLTPEVRSELSAVIKDHALSWSVAFIDNHRIDEINILQATFDAMHASVNDIINNYTKSDRAHTSWHLLIDGNRFRKHQVPHTCLIGGDSLSVSIGAASILAKTARDAWMAEVADFSWPMYGFQKHKGYATLVHRNAIKKFGPCEIHRLSFLSRITTLSLFEDCE